MFDPAHFAQFVVNCLAVGGGFLAGFVLTGVLVWWLDRWLFRGKTAPRLKQAARYLGGILVAVLVALIVFGKGGGGLGGGMGEGLGDGTPAQGTGDGTGPSTTTEIKATTTPTANGERVSVVVLGGSDVREQRFYKIDTDPAAKTFDELKTVIEKRKTDAAGKPVTVEVRFPATNAVPRDHAAVKKLEEWARNNGLTVAFPVS